ncbi:hypothetical protein DFJ43DRAFT_1104261 [Lentinula guzmanii]|uniref:Uncharacterized protein n=1 Tax=Lentinula guzmanii TaxID=2804957 RepID=A0AA38MQR4_9AGAR|nr:hypothetical protein DFJ43DRAFT_1104261 [Lentinula guzmanii]
MDKLIQKYFFFFTLFVLASTYSLDNSTAPYIFNDLYSLLVQWPNTFHPNGHTIIPGILEPYTLLYHARKDTEIPPPSPEWLAFDPEMSYAVMATKLPGPTYMYTYRTTKSAKVLYFNGMSAAWGEGWLDTQYTVLTGQGKTNGSRNNEVSLWDDYGRAKGLCQWSEQRGFDGIVRMNAGFEIIWCNFNSPSLRLVSSLNITPPGTPEARRSFPFPLDADFGQSSSDELPLHSFRPPGRGPGRGRRPGDGGRGPWGYNTAPLARTGFLEWMRAATRYHSTIQPHLSLSYHQMVSFYYPRYQSLYSSRSGKLMQEHLLWEHITDEDVRTFLDELDSVVSTDLPGTEFDWQAAAMDVVAFWADRIGQTQHLLDGVNSTLNLTDVVRTVQQLSYSSLNPFIAYGDALNASGHDIVFNFRSSPSLSPGTIAPETTALERCTYSATEFLAEPELQILMTSQEYILKMSIETILERLCTDFGTLFAESTDLTDSDSYPTFISSWNSRIDTLVRWLEWPAWLRCEEICDLDSICTMPAWPITWGGGPFGGRPGPGRSNVDFLKPTCRRLTM